MERRVKNLKRFFVLNQINDANSVQLRFFCYFCIAQNYAEQNPYFSDCGFDKVLSTRYLAIFGEELPVRTNLFALHFGSFESSRTYQRKLDCDETDCELPSLGRRRLRSCATKTTLKLPINEPYFSKILSHHFCWIFPIGIFAKFCIWTF